MAEQTEGFNQEGSTWEMRRRPGPPGPPRPQRPDVSDMLRKVGGTGAGLGEGFQRILRAGKLLPILLVILIALWLATGIYTVDPGEVGVIRQFGKEVGQTGPGLNWRYPWPIQTHDLVNMQEVRRTEVGFRLIEYPDGTTQRVPMLLESLMVTGDENIADVQALVQYRVLDASQFLFRVKDPEWTLRSGTEAALRTVIGNITIEDAMTIGRPLVEADTKAMLQRLMDDYETGLYILEVKLQVVDPPEEVKDAFHEVVRAREDKERLIREAEGYYEDIVPRARGEATKFLAILAEYEKAKEVTRQRLYLETIEKVLAGTEIFIIDPQSGNNVLQLLPLKDLLTIEQE